WGTFGCPALHCLWFGPGPWCPSDWSVGGPGYFAGFKARVVYRRHPIVATTRRFDRREPWRFISGRGCLRSGSLPVGAEYMRHRWVLFGGLDGSSWTTPPTFHVKRLRLVV